ncbi:tetratricopeptide repeat protein [Beggiatoa alba]|nr:tetratricopeptide repeat protein [Beggiatoa alba]
MKDDKQHVRVWNTFVEELYQLHQALLRDTSVTIKENYGGYYEKDNFFIEKRYYDSKSGKLLSRIQRETRNKNNIHLIEVYLYDQQGRVQVDYLAAFLPDFRNAPVQTLINIHHYNDLLHAFRQFDASGALIYEQCQGSLFNDKVLISLDEDEMINRFSILQSDIENEQYLSCFEFSAKSAQNYLKPMQFRLKNVADTINNDEDTERLVFLTNQIEKKPQNAHIYVKRGDIYFKQHEFEKAVADYSQALKLNDNLDEAYFGRGMALGRQGLVPQGIQDLSVYIKRQPYNSRAYTKRGVRYIWIGNTSAAKNDMLQAIQLDITNAEAHDDLGVIYASENSYDKAIYHFKQSIHYDKSYQKAYHNLAMSYVVTQGYSQALAQVNKGLVLEKNNRNSLLLKSTILEKLGKRDEARTIREYAEFLPEGNWSERFSVE